MPSFEGALSALEQAASNVVKAGKGLVAAGSALRRAATTGDLAALAKARERLARQLVQLRDEVGLATTSWPFNPQGEEDYLKTQYEAELEQAARAKGLSVQRIDGRVLVFPSVVRVAPKEKVIRVDAKRFTNLRPSVVVEQLAKRQSGGSTHAPEVFLEILRRAYLTVTGVDGDGQTKPLRQIYEVLTLLPTTKAQYELSDFVRDVYFLDRSSVRTSRDGRTLKFTAPSTATREGKGYTFYSQNGEEFEYYALAFLGDTK